MYLLLRRRDLANGQEAKARRPVVVVEPIQVQVAPGTDPAEIRHRAVAIDLRDRAQSDDQELVLLLGIFLPESKQMLDLGWFVARFSHLLNRVLRGDVTVEEKERGFEFGRAFPVDREALRRDVVVSPVVATGGDHLVERAGVVDREAERLGRPHEIGK